MSKATSPRFSSRLHQKLGLGTWQLGGPNMVQGKAMGWGEISEEESLAILSAALEAGIQFIDTADSYGKGLSEVIVGNALQAATYPQDIMVCTKFGNVYLPDGTTGQDFSSEHLYASVKASLQRLQREHIDILLMHSPPDNFDWANYDRAPLEDLISQGLIRQYGVSSKSVYGAKRVMDAGFGSVIEVIYNALDRRVDEILGQHPNMSKYDIIGRVPLGSGFLSDRLLIEEPNFGEDDYRSHMADRDKNWMLDNARKLAFLAALPGGLSANALRFTLQNPIISVVIPGARSVNQVKSNVMASNLDALSQELIQRIEQSVPSVPDWWKPSS
ncbi:aldo/keto reductase [Aquirufa aurantiipilula]|uniref:Aldo/keto reductase n=1 Tax=Aquirufa aurantiipilula TaxID=2696561 RepID=A0ABT6BIN8_9BACT|nr:aldo/keto reductase [Aquirufa aurantiipilula]MDF5690168.1 aldo/keto reductase [Aquirufa aurantiipilula]